jgi:hypothetical protein
MGFFALIAESFEGCGEEIFEVRTLTDSPVVVTIGILSWTRL